MNPLAPGGVSWAAQPPPGGPLLTTSLLDFAALLLSRPLTGERLLCTAAIARLQIEGMLLDILDDIFLLHLAFESAQCALDRFAFLNLDFSQA